MKHATLYFLILLIPTFSWGQQEIFNYKKVLNINRTLSVNVNAINRTTGEVLFSGGDTRGPSTPGLTFTWIWGDGTTTNGLFPQTKRYADIKKSYLVKVISTYSANEQDTVELFVNFTKPQINPVSTDPTFKVTIPNQSVSLPNRYSSTPFRLDFFSDAFFKGSFTRAEIEYILSVGNTIEFDLANGNVLKFNGKFEQNLLRDSTFGGGYAIWQSTPVSFALNDSYLTDPVGFTSMLHEMGHNVTLNMPANFLIGEQIGGLATAIYTETMAQIFQHSAGYELVNKAPQYGLDTVAIEILKASFQSSFRQLGIFYKQYIDKGMNYESWADSPISTENALYTYGTIGYKFGEYAEKQGLGYRIPTKRLTQFLQRFNAEWTMRYNRANNTPAANAFRGTMMVAALSHAFQKDLRADFKALKFPISDDDFAYLNPSLLEVSSSTLNLPATTSNATSFSVLSTATSWLITSSQPWLTTSVPSGSGNQVVTLAATANSMITSRTAVITVSATGLSDRTVTIVQDGAAPSLTTSIQSLSLIAVPAGPSSVSITSNTSWSVVSSQSWLTLGTNSGSGNQALTVTATANTLTASRTATLTVSANGTPSQIVTITQAGAPATLATSVASLTVEAVGGSPSVNVTSNTAWLVTSSQPWLISSPTSGSGNVALTLTAATNTAIESRTAIVTVAANGVASQSVSVVQRGIIITATVNPLEETLRIYPNPVSDILHIDGLPLHSTVLLYDAFGRLLLQRTNTTSIHLLTTDTMPVGTYYLRVQSDQKSTGKAFTKMP